MLYWLLSSISSIILGDPGDVFVQSVVSLSCLCFLSVALRPWFALVTTAQIYQHGRLRHFQTTSKVSFLSHNEC